VIEETQTNTKHHMCNTKHDRHLHFERVGECKLVHSFLPNLGKKQTKQDICQEISISLSSALLLPVMPFSATK